MLPGRLSGGRRLYEGFTAAAADSSRARSAVESQGSEPTQSTADEGGINLPLSPMLSKRGGARCGGASHARESVLVSRARRRALLGDTGRSNRLRRHANPNRHSGLCRLTCRVSPALRVHRRGDRQSGHRRSRKTTIVCSTARGHRARRVSRSLAGDAPRVLDRTTQSTQRRLRADGATAPLVAQPQRRSLFDSMSNHMANNVNCDPKISSRATRTTVPTETALPMRRSTTSAIPSPSPRSVITNPRV
jgi:hypothetical protein